MNEKNQTKNFTPWASTEALANIDSSYNKKDKLEQAYDSWKVKPDDMNNVSNLLTALKPTINGAIKSYADNDNRMYTQASIIAMNAVKTYDPSKQVKLNTHVFNQLKRLNRIQSERENVVHIPEGALMDRNKLFKQEQLLEDKIGREPTVTELADATGLSIKRIEALRKGTAYTAESQLLSEKGDTLFTGKSDSQNVWVDYVYADLDPIDKKIFEWSTGYGGSKKLLKKEIAQKLNISAPAVSMRINKIISKLETGYAL